MMGDKYDKGDAYKMRPVEDLEPHYSRHVAAMTREKLHAKSDIAAELACRDWKIERLTQQHESDKTLVQATEACARHHQERAESLTAKVSYLYGVLADLLEDTQHSAHFCGDEDCPVKVAQDALVPDLSICPRCLGPADNGHDRELPPNPYMCTKCNPDDSDLIETVKKRIKDPKTVEVEIDDL